MMLLAAEEYQVSAEGLGNFDDTREWLPYLVYSLNRGCFVIFAPLRFFDSAPKCSLQLRARHDFPSDTILDEIRALATDCNVQAKTVSHAGRSSFELVVHYGS